MGKKGQFFQLLKKPFYYYYYFFCWFYCIPEIDTFVVLFVTICATSLEDITRHQKTITLNTSENIFDDPLNIPLLILSSNFHLFAVKRPNLF